jgi:mannose-6-phosphate isomerase-like protein (cupin superfamily)
MYNPVTHERFTFLKTAEETEGKSTEFECAVTPGGAILPAHVHARQEERFTVISGTLGVMLGGKNQKLYPGQSISLPQRIKHQWWNAGDHEVCFRVEILPTCNFEAVVEAAVGLAREGKLGKNGMPRNPFIMAGMGRLAECYLPGIPIWIQKPMLAIGSSIGLALGYDPTFRTYHAEATASAATEKSARGVA